MSDKQKMFLVSAGIVAGLAFVLGIAVPPPASPDVVTQVAYLSIPEPQVIRPAPGWDPRLAERLLQPIADDSEPIAAIERHVHDDTADPPRRSYPRRHWRHWRHWRR